MLNIKKLKTGKFKKGGFKPKGDSGAIMGHKPDEPALVVNTKPKQVNKPRVTYKNNKKESASAKNTTVSDNLDKIGYKELHNYELSGSFKPLYEGLLKSQQTANTTIDFSHEIQDVLNALYLNVWKKERRKCSNKELICLAITRMHNDASISGLKSDEDNAISFKGVSGNASSLTFPLIIQDMINDIYMATWAKYRRKVTNKEVICRALLVLFESI